MHRYGIPTTSESSDTCVSDSESLAEAKKRYPQRLRMIVTTGDVAASASLDDDTVAVNVGEVTRSEQLWADCQSQQPTFPEARAPRASSSSSSSSSLAPSSQVENKPADCLDARPIASAAHGARSHDDRGSLQLSSEWAVLDQCIYPAGPVRRTNYRVTFPLIHHPSFCPALILALTSDICFRAQPLDNWLASDDQDCFLACWVRSPHADDCQSASSKGSDLSEDIDDPIAQMLKAREKALLAALRYADAWFFSFWRAQLTICSQCAGQCLSVKWKQQTFIARDMDT